MPFFFIVSHKRSYTIIVFPFQLLYDYYSMRFRNTTLYVWEQYPRKKNKGICFSGKTDTFTFRAYLLHIGRYPLHCSLGFCKGGQGWMSLWQCFFWNGLAVLRLCHNHGLGNIVWLLCFSWFPTICHILSFFCPFLLIYFHYCIKICKTTLFV